jgi:hypothetical protein
LHRPLEQFLKESHAQIFDASELPAGRLFKKYFAGEPPFGRGSSKRRASHCTGHSTSFSY